jgi:hypothetical protein
MQTLVTDKACWLKCLALGDNQVRGLSWHALPDTRTTRRIAACGPCKASTPSASSPRAHGRCSLDV